MEKQRADKLILKYRDKIFGFALGKTRNISAAEELASDIVCGFRKNPFSRWCDIWRSVQASPDKR